MFQKLVLCVFLTTFVVTQAGDYQQTIQQWDMSHQDVQPESQAYIENFDHDFTLSSSGAPSGHGFFGVYKPDTNEDYEEDAQVPLRPPLLRLSPGKSSKPGKSGKDKSKYDKDSSSEDTKYSPFGKDFGKYSSEEQKPKFGGKFSEEQTPKFDAKSSEEQKSKFDGKTFGKKKDLKPSSKDEKTFKYDQSVEADYSQNYFPEYPSTFARPVLPVSTYQGPSYDSHLVNPYVDKKPSFYDSFSHQLATDYDAVRNKAILLTDQESKYSTPPKNIYNYPYPQVPQTPNLIYEPYKPQYGYPVPTYYYNPIYSYEQYETPTDQFDSTHGTVSYRPKLQLTSPEATINTPTSNIQKISPTPVFPGLYWKNLGDQYKDSFIKAKADVLFPSQSPGQLVNPDGTATPVYPGLIWYTYGQNIGKAFTDAKLNSPYPAIATPPPVQSAPDHGTFNPTYVPVLQASKVDKAPIESTTKVPSVYGVYWSSFGEKIKEAFNKTKTTTPAPIDGTPSSTPVPLANPALFWSTFGTQMAKAFTDAKFKISSATKPTPPPTGIVDPLATPAPEIDELFWQNFEKQLEDIMTPTTSTVPPPAIDLVQQQVQPFEGETQQMINPSYSKPITNQYQDQQLTQDQVLQQFRPYKVYDDIPSQEISQQTMSQQYLDQSPYGISHDVIEGHPKLQLSKVKDVTSKPDLYWKTFGEKIKETFNKTSTVAPSGADPLDATVTPPGFWTNFGKMIGKAFVETKTKLVAATLKAKSTTVAPSIDDADSLIVQEPETEDDINDEFWSNFEQQLSHALTPSVEPKVDTQQQIDLSQDLTDDSQHVQQIVIDDDDLSQKLSHQLVTGPNKLQLSAGIDGQVAEPDLYWKNYGQEFADNFNTARGQIKDQVDSFDPMVEEDKAGFWSRFGLDIKNTFNDAKFKAMDISDKIQNKLG